MKQQNILILGLAKSGEASFNLLYNKHNKFYLYDESPNAISLFLEKTRNLTNVFLLKKLDNCLLEFITLIILSPSFSAFSSFILQAKHKKIQVISELELGYNYCKNNIIAVTGTNGKTTTINLLNAIFSRAKKPCKMVGNIGVPLTSVVKKISCKTLLLCEVSSFQLEAICKFAPKECAILNVTPDHIARHGSFSKYKQAKFNMLKNLKNGSKIVVSSTLFKSNFAYFRKLKKGIKIYQFGFKKVPFGCYVENENIVFSKGKNKQIICNVNCVKLRGLHNLENILASICFAKFHRIKNKYIVEALTNFLPPAHRIQKVYEHNTNTIYDDSKATNIDATIKAVNSFTNALTLIVGGSDKGYNYNSLFENLPPNVTTIIACGEVRNKIKQAGDNYNKQVILFKTLKQATIYACQNLKENESLLLSPASASFDEFKNYKDRGEKFLSYIKSYYES